MALPSFNEIRPPKKCARSFKDKISPAIPFLKDNKTRTYYLASNCVKPKSHPPTFYTSQCFKNGKIVHLDVKKICDG